MMSGTLRTSQACIRCREKKRRCDGSRPRCGLCARFALECKYPDHNGRSRTRSGKKGDLHPNLSPPLAAASNDSNEASPGQESSALIEQRGIIQSTSGVLSAALVRAQIQGSDSFSQTQGSFQVAPWNLGIGHEDSHLAQHGTCLEAPLGALLSWTVFVRYATVFINDIYPVFGSFSTDEFWQSAQDTWQGTVKGSKCYNARLSFVVALGALFTRDSSIATTYFKHAERHLSNHLITDTVGTHDLDSLILRTLYLRLTVSPSASWLSSWTMMGVVESLTVTIDESDSWSADGKEDNHTAEAQLAHEYQQKRVLVARLLNAWISNESARPRPVHDRHSLKQNSIPSSAPRSPSWDLLRLYDLSEKLDPRRPQAKTEILEPLLQAVCDFETNHDVVKMSKTNLAIVIFRRWRWSAKSSRMPTELVDKLIETSILGLEAVQRLALQHQPWHHVANVPFQILCTLLLLDTRESLSLVGLALRTLMVVRKTFDTPATSATLDTARQLVALAQKRKQKDSSDLSTAMEGLLNDEYASLPAVQSSFQLPQGNHEQTSDDFYHLANWDEINWDAMLSGEDPMWSS